MSTTMEPCPIDQHVFDEPCDCGDDEHFMCRSCGAQLCHECGHVVILVDDAWLHQSPLVKACFLSDTLKVLPR